MKIKGKEWMDWLHKSRAETEQQRKSRRQTLSHYLRIVEGKEALPDKKVLRPSAKRGR